MSWRIQIIVDKPDEEAIKLYSNILSLAVLSGVPDKNCSMTRVIVSTKEGKTDESI